MDCCQGSFHHQSRGEAMKGCGCDGPGFLSRKMKIGYFKELLGRWEEKVNDLRFYIEELEKAKD
jgi:Cys-tRNA synthase (O-phospho-L-seryl-tRNA:Cys-tRNA synthase)